MLVYSHCDMKKDDIKIVFVDIDWTLYDHKHHKYDKKSIKALNMLQQSGVYIVLCSARPYYSIREFDTLNHISPDGIICSCGSITIFKDKVINPYLLDSKTLHKVVNVCEKHNLCIELVDTYDRFYALPKNEYVDLHHTQFFEKDCPVIRYEKQEINSALLFAPKEMDKMLINEFPKNVIYNRFGDWGIDIIIERHDKGKAVTNLLDYLKINKDSAIAFGDDEVDIPMIESVTYGVAMGNGIESLKKVSFDVTAPIWKHGIYKFLRKYKLIKPII